MKTKNFIYTFLLISILSISMTSYSQMITEEWVARYNGPGNSWDVAHALAVDSFGNVYVSGYSSGIGTSWDYATIKYNSSGIQQWVAGYNGPGNDIDVAHALAVDDSGYVYVTGRSLGSGTGNDYATIKYNSSGVEQWITRYNGPGNGGDGATSLAVDGSGNVYVAGYSMGIGTNDDYAIIKYNSSGIEQWVARYNGSANSIDQAISLTIDGLGNVYVTGKSYGNDINEDYLTIKYNSFGVEQWVARYNGPGNGDDEARSLVVDVSGNVYVTGRSSGSGTGDDYATIKYNSSGVEQWVARYNGSANSLDNAYSLAVDDYGNVYVTGASVENSTSFDYVTIKYNSSGIQQWISRYNGAGNSVDAAYSIAIDGSGNVYVTGGSEGSGTGRDYATIKYNLSGVEQWVARYNGPGNSEDQARSIIIDGSGNVYVTGWSWGIGTSHDYATIKYSQTIGITPISNEIPTEYTLSQNFPNPFNPTTIINFQLPISNYVALKIYDALGKEVETLISQQLPPGTYSVEWNALNYPSGMYYYKFSTGDFIETKKMVLIR